MAAAPIVLKQPSLLARMLPVVLFAALAAGGLVTFLRLAVGGFSYSGAWNDRSIYDANLLVPIAATGACAVVMAMARSALVGRRALLVGFVASVQLAGTGVVAYRRWLTASGFTAPPDNLRALRGLAVTLAIGGFGTAVVAGIFLVLAGVRPGLRARRESSRVDRSRVAALGGGLVIAVAVPLLMGNEQGSRGVTSMGAHALMYGGPWAVGVVVSVWAGKSSTRWGLAAIAVSILIVAIDARLIIPASSGGTACVVAMAVVAVVELVTRRDSGDPTRLARSDRRADPTSLVAGTSPPGWERQ